MGYAPYSSKISKTPSEFSLRIYKKKISKIVFSIYKMRFYEKMDQKFGISDSFYPYPDFLMFESFKL
jgi:hypothetical protein